MPDKNNIFDGSRVTTTQRDAMGRLLPGHTVWRKHLHKVTRKGSRNKISKAFVEALLRDFELHGYEAIEACRIFDPAKYLHIVASLSLKEETLRPEEQMSDDELNDALTGLTRTLTQEALANQ
jgi:hypothetical protein